jgi:energy-coupling factor transporter transmembrane protein EcfT
LGIALEVLLTTSFRIYDVAFLIIGLHLHFEEFLKLLPLDFMWLFLMAIILEFFLIMLWNGSTVSSYVLFFNGGYER